jgi:hypothetical protein
MKARGGGSAAGGGGAAAGAAAPAGARGLPPPPQQEQPAQQHEPPQVLLLVKGLPGSGKTTLARWATGRRTQCGQSSAARPCPPSKPRPSC